MGIDEGMVQRALTIFIPSLQKYLGIEDPFYLMVVNYMLMSVLGCVLALIMGNWCEFKKYANYYLRKAGKWLFRKILGDLRYPTLTFEFREREKWMWQRTRGGGTHGKQIYLDVNDCVKAWLQMIFKELQVKPSPVDLLTVRIVNEDYGKDTQVDEDGKLDLTNTSRFLEYYLPDDDCYTMRLGDDIWCYLQSWVETIEEKAWGGTASKKFRFFRLVTYTTKERGNEYLAQFNKKLEEDYKLTRLNEFSNRSFIFELQDEPAPMLNQQGNGEKPPIQWAQYPFESNRRFDQIWFEQQERFLSTYRHFMSEEGREEYDRRGDPYTFSALLYGPPGCGKTSMTKALVNYDRSIKANGGTPSHLFIVPFNKVKSQKRFRDIMLSPYVNDTYIPLKNRIVVFEDFDASEEAARIFKIRDALKDFSDGPKAKPAEKKSGNDNSMLIAAAMMSANSNQSGNGGGGGMSLGGLLGDDSQKITLSDVLNVIDGIKERTGQRCIWTTNVEPKAHFDPAFLRPGRMDMIIELGKCSRTGVKNLVKAYYSTPSQTVSLTEEQLDLIPADLYTPAMVKQCCKESGREGRLDPEKAVLSVAEVLSKPTQEMKSQLAKQARKKEEAELVQKPLAAWKRIQEKYKEHIIAIYDVFGSKTEDGKPGPECAMVIKRLQKMVGSEHEFYGWVCQQFHIEPEKEYFGEEEEPLPKALQEVPTLPAKLIAQFDEDELNKLQKSGELGTNFGGDVLGKPRPEELMGMLEVISPKKYRDYMRRQAASGDDEKEAEISREDALTQRVASMEAALKKSEELRQAAEAERTAALADKKRLQEELKRSLPHAEGMYRSKSWDVKTKVTHIYTPTGDKTSAGHHSEGEQSIESTCTSTGHTEEVVGVVA